MGKAPQFTLTLSTVQSWHKNKNQIFLDKQLIFHNIWEYIFSPQMFVDLLRNEDKSTFPRCNNSVCISADSEGLT